jgi:hypothetical protein
MKSENPPLRSNPHVAFDHADLPLTNPTLMNLGGLTLSDVASDLALELTALTSLTSTSRR